MGPAPGPRCPAGNGKPPRGSVIYSGASASWRGQTRNENRLAIKLLSVIFRRNFGKKNNGFLRALVAPERDLDCLNRGTDVKILMYIRIYYLIRCSIDRAFDRWN